MSSTDSILYRSIAAPYYRRNAGFFLFIFFLMFGLQQNFKQTLAFHYVIIDGISSLANFFFIAFFTWLLYAGKAIHFVNGCIKNKAYTFLEHLNALSPGRRFVHLLSLYIKLLAPVLIYGIFVIIVAITNHHVTGGLTVAFTLMALCLFSAGTTNFLLQKTEVPVFKLNTSSLLFRSPPSLFSFLLKYIFREQLIMLLLLKLATFSGLYFFAKTDSQLFEDRMLWLIFLTSLISHCVLIYRNHHFIETKMLFYRNLPVKPFRTLLPLLGVYFVVLIPEIWALKGVAIEQHALMGYVWMILAGPALLLLLHCLLYTDDMKMEGFLQLLFGIWIVSVFFSLSPNRWLLPLIYLAMSSFIFFSSYNKYEKKTEVEGLE